jgi:hypothetical protein
MLHSFITIKSSFFALLLTVSMNSSFAAPAASPAEGINSRVESAFHKDFNKAELIGFETGRDHTRLTLKINDVILFAFYSDNGDLLAVTRNIRSSQLPLSLLRELKNKYNDYWISDLFELSIDDQNNYYITLENTDSKVTLRSSDNNSWEKYEKINKD